MTLQRPHADLPRHPPDPQGQPEQPERGRVEDGRPKDTDPSDMTDFEKNVAHEELEHLDDETPG